MLLIPHYLNDEDGLLYQGLIICCTNIHKWQLQQAEETADRRGSVSSTQGVCLLALLFDWSGIFFTLLDQPHNILGELYPTTGCNCLCLHHLHILRELAY